MLTLNQIVEKLRADESIFLNNNIFKNNGGKSTEESHDGKTVFITHPMIGLYLAPTSEMHGMNSYEEIAERINQFMTYVVKTVGTRPDKIICKPEIRGNEKLMWAGRVSYDAEIARGTITRTLTTDDPFILTNNPNMRKLIETGYDKQDVIHKRSICLACYPTQDFAKEALQIARQKPYAHSLAIDISNILLAQTVHR